MADNKDKGTLGQAGEILKAPVDLITKFWEGIAQIGFEIFKDRSVIQTLILYLVGLISFDIFTTKLEDLIKEDSDQRMLARQETRHEFFLLCKDIGGVALKAAFKKVGEAYEFLQKKELMNDGDFKAFIAKLEKATTDFKAQREQSLKKRKWCFCIGWLALIALLFCATSDQGGYLTWFVGTFALLAVAGIVIMFTTGRLKFQFSPARGTP